MNLAHPLVALAALAVVAGCASDPAPQKVAMAAAPAAATASSAPARQSCHKESPIGSNHLRTVCEDMDVDPNDPNKQRAIDDAARQIGLMQRQMGRNN